MKYLFFLLIFILSNLFSLDFNYLNSKPVFNDPLTEQQLVQAKKIETFFAKRDMPLAEYSEKFVEVASRNNLPYNFLPAIAIVESQGGIAGSRATKNNNPFGWGSKKIVFEDFGEAIDTVGHKLANHKYYKNKNITQKLAVYNQVDKQYRAKVFKYMSLIDKEKV